MDSLVGHQIFSSNRSAIFSPAAGEISGEPLKPPNSPKILKLVLVFLPTRSVVPVSRPSNESPHILSIRWDGSQNGLKRKSWCGNLRVKVHVEYLQGC